jgi:hypothetical protein
MIGKHIGVVNGNYFAPNKIRLRVLLRAATPAYEWNFDITDLDCKLAPDLDQGTPEKNILKATIGHDMTHSYSFQSLWVNDSYWDPQGMGYKLENFTVNLGNVYTATRGAGYVQHNVVTAFFGVQDHRTRTSYKFYLGRNNVAWLQSQGTKYPDERMNTYVCQMDANFSGAGNWRIICPQMKTNSSAAYNDQ